MLCRTGALQFLLQPVYALSSILIRIKLLYNHLHLILKLPGELKYTNDNRCPLGRRIPLVLYQPFVWKLISSFPKIRCDLFIFPLSFIIIPFMTPPYLHSYILLRFIILYSFIGSSNFCWSSFSPNFFSY